eukprot:Rmarinus@m.20059
MIMEVQQRVLSFPPQAGAQLSYPDPVFGSAEVLTSFPEDEEPDLFAFDEDELNASAPSSSAVSECSSASSYAGDDMLEEASHSPEFVSGSLSGSSAPVARRMSDPIKIRTLTAQSIRPFTWGAECLGETFVPPHVVVAKHDSEPVGGLPKRRSSHPIAL